MFLEGDVTKRDATTINQLHDFEKRVVVDDPLTKGKQLILGVVGETSSPMPKDPALEESFVGSEHEDLHEYIEITTKKPIVKYFQQVLDGQAFLSVENLETTTLLLRLQPENAQKKEQIP